MPKKVVQEHHLSYDPEVKVKLFKGEHWLVTQIYRWKRAPSRGFIIALKSWLALNEHRAEEL